jgi:gelsolin
VEALPSFPPKLFRLSESAGSITYESVVPATYTALSSDDAFLVDNSAGSEFPAIYVWIGENSSQVERRLAVQYGHSRVELNLVKMTQGRESAAFLHVMQA